MDRQIKFTVGKLESLQNTVGILVLHPDQKLMPALLDMGKIIVAFVTSVRRDQRRNRRIQIVNQFDERAVFIALFEFLDQNNKLNPVWMGSYGIGPARCMAALVEQNNDANGIIWPSNIAPFKVAIVIISLKDEAQVAAAEKLYNDLTALGIEPILDDRDERPGVKFKDMDLIGIPYRITVGKKINEGIVEFKGRTEEKADSASSFR